MDASTFIEIFKATLILTIVAIAIFTSLSGLYMSYRIKRGTLKGRSLIEATSVLLLHSFKKEGRNWKLDLNTTSSIDEKLNELIAQKGSGHLLNDANLVFEYGCFLGQILHHKLGARWIEAEQLEYPVNMKLKDDRIISPFEIIREKIASNDQRHIYHSCMELRNR